MKITISTDVFAAVSLFRGITDVRFYLNGLHLETGTEGARLVATDGRQLAVSKIVGSYPESSITLPNSIVATVKLKARGAKFVILDFEEGHPTCDESGVFVARNIVLNFADMTVIGIEVDGKFPDYRRVVPTSADGNIAQYDPALLMRVQKASNMLGFPHFSGIAQNGGSSGFSVLTEDLLVVTMPYRAEPEMTTPAWVQASLNPPADTVMQRLAA